MLKLGKESQTQSLSVRLESPGSLDPLHGLTSRGFTNPDLRREEAPSIIARGSAEGGGKSDHCDRPYHQDYERSSRISQR